jgi:cytochrome c oxidase subunit 1
MDTPMYFAIGFISLFIIGGLSGIMHASPPTDLQQTDTYFVVAHFHYVLFGGSVFALFAGLYYWIPKVTGRLLHEGLGKLHFWLTFISFNVTFFPMHYLGMHGMPRRTFTYLPGLGFDLMNLISTIGSFVLGAAMLVFVWNLLRSLKHGERAGDNPWSAATLEWTLPSPPPHYNYRVIPQVSGRDPLWHEDGAYLDPEDPAAPEPVMPSPSGWPIILASGPVIAASGALLSSLPVVLLGVVVLVAGIYGWAFQPLER